MSFTFIKKCRIQNNSIKQKFKEKIQKLYDSKQALKFLVLSFAFMLLQIAGYFLRQFLNSYPNWLNAYHYFQLFSSILIFVFHIYATLMTICGFKNDFRKEWLISKEFMVSEENQ